MCTAHPPFMPRRKLHIPAHSIARGDSILPDAIPPHAPRPAFVAGTLHEGTAYTLQGGTRRLLQGGMPKGANEGHATDPGNGITGAKGSLKDSLNSPNQAGAHFTPQGLWPSCLTAVRASGSVWLDLCCPTGRLRQRICHYPT